MRHICDFCEHEIQDGDYITFVGETKYKKLGSKIAFALNTSEMVVYPETLCHKQCRRIVDSDSFNQYD